MDSKQQEPDAGSMSLHDYGAEYYKSHCGPLPYDRSEPHWSKFFGDVADELIRVFRPRRVFDAGCAHGFLVEAFWDRGVQAWGRDISSYAISQVRADVRPFCAVGSLAEPIEGRYDLVICLEVLEHMEPEHALAAAANLVAASDQIVFSSSPSDLEEPTHVNVKPPIYWLRVFREHGFRPIPRLKLLTIAPWTMALGKADDSEFEAELARDAEIAHGRIALAGQAHQIAHLGGAVADRDRQLTARVAHIQELSAAVTERDERIAQANEQVDRQRADMERALQEERAARNAAEAQAAELRAHADALARQVDAQDHEIKAYAGRLHEHAATLKAHHDAMAQADERLSTAIHEIQGMNAGRRAIGAAGRELGTQLRRTRAELDEIRRAHRAIRRSWRWKAASLFGLWPAMPVGAAPMRPVGETVDPDWYFRAYPDVAANTLSAEEHYRRHGRSEGRAPNGTTMLPDLDPDWYLAENPDVLASGSGPWEHFLDFGHREGRPANERDRLAASFAFDPAWYLKTYLDVAEAGLDPSSHFWSSGRFEGRHPNAEAALAASAGRHPNAQAALAANLGFDAAWYLREYPDVAAAGLDAWSHFKSDGRAEGRHPNAQAALAASAEFDAAWYLREYPDVATAGLDARSHFESDGRAEGRHPNAQAALAANLGFDAAWYLCEYPDVAAAGLDPLSHFRSSGRAEGRFASGRDAAEQNPIKLHDLCDPERDEGAPKTRDDAFKVSVLTPTYETEPRYLRELHQSLRNQLYENWEWVVVDDGSSRADTIAALREIADSDPHVKLTLNPVNGGISVASNTALRCACGTHMALVDHDDLLARNALLEIYKAWKSERTIDLFYTDECKLLADGRLGQFWPKPDWSPAYLENTMSIGHLSVYEAAFLRAVGGFRSEYDGTQDFDLALRASLRRPRVRHLPIFAYLWRVIPGSSAADINEKHYAIERQGRAVLDYAQQVVPGAEVSPGWGAGYWRIRYPLPEPTPLLSYVIPTGGGTREIRGVMQDLVTECVRSFERASFYPRCEFVVVHNGDLSDRQRDDLLATEGLRLVHYDEPAFNFSRKLNLGVRHARGDVICLLNDDVQAITPRGGDDLVSYMMANPDVGAIGPLCLFENDAIQQNGVVLLPDIGPAHAGAGQNRSFGGHQAHLRCRREAGSIGGAVMFVARSVYDELGGFSEDLPLNYNDVDFCLRLRARGLRCIVDPCVEVYHLEGATKEGTSNVEQERLFARHGAIEDPFFSQWLDGGDPNYRVRLTRSDPASAPFGSWLDRRIADRSRRVPSGETTFTVAVSVYNQPRRLLVEMYNSVVMQTYERFEFVILDNGSTNPETRDWIAFVEREGRARILRHSENAGIIGGQRRLLDAATGDVFVPIDSDDFLSVDALQMIALAIESNPGRKIFYSDEYKSNPQSVRFQPFMKPDFDPILLTNCCYPAHLMAIEVEFLRSIRGYSDTTSDWSHDLDTIVRSLRAGQEPKHVRELIYAWRINPGSTASAETDAKPDTVISQHHALRRLLEDRDLLDRISIVPNTLETSSGMWRLTASRPVENVRVLSEAETWGEDGIGLSGLLALSREGGSEWIAILRKPHDEEALLLLSAVAAFDPRIAAVSGLLLKQGTSEMLWSGGLFLPGGRLFDPYAGRLFAEGGYHGQLWCQRCVDVAAPVNVLLRTSTIARVAEQPAHLEGADWLMVQLGLDAHERGDLVAVTPHLRAEGGGMLPLDRAGSALGSPALATGSRWYDGRLSSRRPYDFTDWSVRPGSNDELDRP